MSALIPSGLHGQAGPEAAPGQSPLQKNAFIQRLIDTAAPNLAQLTAIRASDGCLEFRTSGEVGSLGYHVYRMSRAGWRRVNGELLVAVDQPSAGAYRIRDPFQPSSGTVDYAILQILDSGKSNILASVQVPIGHEGLGDWAGIDDATPPRSQRSAHLAETVPDRLLAAPSSGILPQLVKLVVAQSGVVYVGSGDIATASGRSLETIRKWLAGGRLGLFRDGQAVSFWPASGGDGFHFRADVGLRPAVYFIGGGDLTQRRPIPGRAAAIGAVTRATREWVVELDRTPALTLEALDVDGLWMWGRAVAGNTSAARFTSGFELSGTDVTEPVSLRVDLWGGSESAHDAEITINNNLLGETTWSGKTPRSVVFNVAAGVFLNGNNSIAVRALGSTLSRIYLDRIVLQSRHAVNSRPGGVFYRATNPVVTVGGLTGPNIRVFRVDGGAFELIEGVTAGIVAGEWRASHPATPGEYAAIESGQELSPQRIEAAWLPGLSGRKWTLDHAVIAPQAMALEAEQLSAFRRGQGMSSQVILAEDIANEFGGGTLTASALKAFFAHMHASWSKAPRYVTLAGKGTYDERNILGFGDHRLPTAWIGIGSGLFSSDGTLADVDGDGVSDFWLGRIPAANAAQLALYVSKMIEFESGQRNKAVVVADQSDGGGDFSAEAGQVVTNLTVRYSVSALQGDPDVVRTNLLGQLTSGNIQWLGYVGHGGIDRLGTVTRPYLRIEDLPQIGTDLCVLSAASCVVGQFGVPGQTCLGEAMLFRATGGAAAVWSPSSLSLNPEAGLMHTTLTKAVCGGYGYPMRLGEAVRFAAMTYKTIRLQAGYSVMYNLLGDSALKVQ